MNHRYPGEAKRRGSGDCSHLPITRRKYKFGAAWLKPTKEAIADAKAKGQVGIPLGPGGKPIELSEHSRDSDASL